MIRSDDGGHLGYIDQAAVDSLAAIVKASPHKDYVNAWVMEASPERKWNPLVKRTKRRYEILRAAHHLSRMLDDEDPSDLVRAFLATVMDSDQPLHPTTPIGDWLGALYLEEAVRLSDMAQAVADGAGVTFTIDQRADVAAA